MPLAVDHSPIAAVYAVVGSLTAALAVLMVAALLEVFKRRRSAIAISVLAGFVTFASMFFLYVWVYHPQFQGRDTTDPTDIIASALFLLCFGGFAAVFATLAVCRDAPGR